MEEIGITKKLAGVVGHGLRAEFAVNMARVKGFDPATEDYTGENPPWDELQSKIKEVSELMGHSRTQIMASYFGAFKRDTSGGVDYVGVAGTKKHKEQEQADNYASPSAKTIVEPQAEAPLPAEGAASVSNDSRGKEAVMELTQPERHNATQARADHRAMTRLIPRFSAPEYRGRGSTTPAGGKTTATEPKAERESPLTQRPEDRQMKLPLKERLAVILSKPAGRASDRT
jgi:hypothetical protein